MTFNSRKRVSCKHQTYPDITARWLFVLVAAPSSSDVLLLKAPYLRENRVAFQDGNAMEDKTFRRHVRWMRTMRAVGHICTGIFSADGKQGHEGISLLRFA